MTSSQDGKRLLVIGEIIVDEYMTYDISNDIENNGIIGEKKTEQVVLGGATRVVHALKEMGHTLTLISSIGDDKYTKIIVDILKSYENVNEFLSYSNKENIIRRRIRNTKGTQIMRINEGANIAEDIYPFLLDLVNNRDINIEAYDAIIISDYNKGMIRNSSIKLLKELSILYKINIYMDSKNPHMDFSNIFLAKVNRDEFEKIKDYYHNSQLEDSLETGLGCKITIITDENLGLRIYTETGLKYCSFMQNKLINNTEGAGDLFFSIVISLQLVHLDIVLSCRYANDITNYILSTNKNNLLSGYIYREKIFGDYSHKILFQEPVQDIELIIENLKVQKATISFVNGCFDIFHIGHLDLLKYAKSISDVLFVAINTDDSIRKIKGTNRPIMSEKLRAAFLSHLDIVDYVVIFSDNNPKELLRIIKPDYVVKGEDYDKKDIPEIGVIQENNSKLIIMKNTHDISTSGLITDIYNIKS